MAVVGVCGGDVADGCGGGSAESLAACRVFREKHHRHRPLGRAHIQGIFRDMSVLAWNLSVCEVEAVG